MNKIILLAGSGFEATNFLRGVYPRELRERMVYAALPDQILGIHAEGIIEIGTFWERKDSDKLMDLAKSRIR